MSYINHPAISYDAKFDVMSYIWGDTSNSYGDEDIDNIIALKDINSDEILGYTILNFKRICEKKTSEYDIIASLFNIKEAMRACGF